MNNGGVDPSSDPRMANNNGENQTYEGIEGSPGVDPQQH